MAALVKGLGALWNRKNEERMVILGLDASGKTTLLYKLKLGEIVTTIPTVGFNVETIEHDTTNFTLWDVGGCDKMRPLLRHYITPDTLLLFVHSCAEERIEESIEAFHQGIENMLGAGGAKFLWMLVTQQDRLPAETRFSTVQGLHRRFEYEMSKYRNDGIVCNVLDLPGFSAHTGDEISNLLSSMQATLEEAKHNGHRRNLKTPSTPLLSRPPSDSNLIARIVREGDDESDADEFWQEFLSCNIQEWNHRNHLRAGYLVLLQTFKDGKGLFDASETFLEHLKRLKELKPERFTNTAHRTLTVFFLYHIQLAILDFRYGKNSENWPARGDFQEVLLHSPQLMNSGLWKEYYSKELLFSPEAREYYRLPDLAALPDFTVSLSKLPYHVRRNSREEPYRLMRFAYTVVQRYMSSNTRRGQIIKIALASLQSTTMRLRARNPAMSPYSETQAYFWIQLIHAALASNSKRPPSLKAIELSLDTPLLHVSFSSFRVLFDLEPTAWRTFYSSQVWNSVEARIAFVNPDLKPLPNVINIPSSENVGRAMNRQLDSAKLGVAAELPSVEDLTFRANMVLEDIKMIPSPITNNITNHAQLLMYLYENIIVSTDCEPAISSASRATSVLAQLSGPYMIGLTQKAFWIQHFLGATISESLPRGEQVKDSIVSGFEQFLKENLHLVYEDLPLCYYSAEVLHSLDARNVFVGPDRRKMEGFFAIQGKEPEDEWVIL